MEGGTEGSMDRWMDGWIFGGRVVGMEGERE